MCAAKRVLLLVLVSVVCGLPALAQKKTKAQLQKEKQQTLEKREELDKIIDETSAKKKNSLGELAALKQSVQEQENLVTSIRGEVRLLDTEIGENNDIIIALEEDLVKLKKEYASMLFAAQKANNSTTRLTFLFSAKSFDQLVMRLRYMDQYAETRKLQAEQIIKVQDQLSGHVREIEVRRTEKGRLLAEEERENENLADLKQKQSALVKSLEKEEKRLRKDLAEMEKAISKLENLINEAIKEEAARAAAAAREKSTASVNAVAALSSSFEDNKNKFPWPVSSGFVSLKFGRQAHPVLKGIWVQNNGVNIQTKENERVKSIFEGEVRRVAFIPTLGSTVIINHGDYLTVYAGLKEVFVRAGQKVTTNQEIGKIFSNADGVSELRFQIFRNMTALDPEGWLKDM